MNDKVGRTVAVAENNNKKIEVDLEEAMEIAGAGRYQVFHCTLMIASLCSSLLELIGYQFILPAAACDLDLPDSIRGLITSIPNIGIIVTAPFWGRAADYFGRKPILLLSTASCGLISLLAAFMPNLLSFALCKLAGALFISCPTSLSFAYAGEMAPRRRRDLAVLACNGFLTLSAALSPSCPTSFSFAYAGEMAPRRRRDLAVLACNGFLTLSAALSPLLAWAVLSADWQFYIGPLSVRPWRLLTIVYAFPMVITAIWMTQAKESPKFLMAKGRKEEALEVLRHMFAANSGLPKEKYDVVSLKRSSEELIGSSSSSEGSVDNELVKNEGSALALLRPPHLKWFALTSFLMFGLYTSLNGLFLFATDTINKVLRETDQNGTLCTIVNQPENVTTSSDCVDTISHDTFVIMAATTTVYGILVLVASICPLSKKTLLVAMYLVSAAACFLAVLITNMVIAGAAFSALQITALGIGSLTAYTVQLFPTSLSNLKHHLPDER